MTPTGGGKLQRSFALTSAKLILWTGRRLLKSQIHTRQHCCLTICWYFCCVFHIPNQNQKRIQLTIRLPFSDYLRSACTWGTGLRITQCEEGRVELFALRNILWPSARSPTVFRHCVWQVWAKVAQTPSEKANRTGKINCEKKLLFYSTAFKYFLDII